MFSYVNFMMDIYISLLVIKKCILSGNELVSKLEVEDSWVLNQRTVGTEFSVDENRIYVASPLDEYVYFYSHQGEMYARLKYKVPEIIYVGLGGMWVGTESSI